MKFFKLPRTHLLKIITVCIILVGFGFFMMPSMAYGFRERCVLDQCGVYFTNIFRATDDLWHMALAEVAFRTHPFQLPIYAGEQLQSYHYLYSYLLRLLSNLGGSVLLGYYLFFPILWFIAFTGFTIVITGKLFKERIAIPIFLFFSYFSSSFSYLLSIKSHGSFWNDIGWFSNQPGEYMINPTFALSILILQVIVVVLLSFKNLLMQVTMLAVLLFALWGSKFYGGIIGFVFIAIYLISGAIQKRRPVISLGFPLFTLTLISILSIVFFYNPFAASKGAVFLFEPFKTIHPIIEDPNLLPITRLARLRYILYGHPYLFFPILLIIEFFTLCLYLGVSFGTRILGLGSLWYSSRSIPIYAAIVGSSVVSILFPSLFTQVGSDWFNTVQFFGYAQFLLQITLAGYVTGLATKGTIRSNIAMITIMVITFIGALNPIMEYGKVLFLLRSSSVHKIFQPLVYISHNEVEALDFLSMLSPGATYTFPFQNIGDSRPSKELWRVHDTAYVAALGKQQLYEANVQQLDVLRIHHQKRTESLRDISKIDIRRLPIQYLYLHKSYPGYKNFIVATKPFVRLLYENSEVSIYEKRI